MNSRLEHNGSVNLDASETKTLNFQFMSNILIVASSHKLDAISLFKCAILVSIKIWKKRI